LKRDKSKPNWEIKKSKLIKDQEQVLTLVDYNRKLSDVKDS